MQFLCKNRCAKMQALADLYGVTVRTIKRDIDELGDIIPIVTQKGRYEGGVKIMDGYSWDKIYMSKEDICLLNEVCQAAKEKKALDFNAEKLIQLENIIRIYTNPKFIF